MGRKIPKNTPKSANGAAGCHFDGWPRFFCFRRKQIYRAKKHIKKVSLSPTFSIINGVKHSGNGFIPPQLLIEIWGAKSLKTLPNIKARLVAIFGGWPRFSLQKEREASFS